MRASEQTCAPQTRLPNRRTGNDSFREPGMAQARQEPVKPQKSASSRAKGKERAVELEETPQRDARPAKEASKASKEANESSSNIPAASDIDAGSSNAPGDSAALGNTEILTARYPSSDLLSTGPANPPIQIEMLRHPFNTHVFVENLVMAGMHRDRAEVLMEAARLLALREIDRARETLTSKIAAENDAYLYSAALSELRTEIQVDVREETLAQKSANARIHRRIESLSQTTSEQVEGLKSEIKYEFQHARDETNADIKNMELRLQDVTNRMAFMFGQERAELENLRSFVLRYILTVVAGIASIGIVFNEASRERPKLPSVQDFGIKPLENPEAELPEAPVRRVGEEEEEN